MDLIGIAAPSTRKFSLIHLFNWVLKKLEMEKSRFQLVSTLFFVNICLSFYLIFFHRDNQVSML